MAGPIGSRPTVSEGGAARDRSGSRQVQSDAMSTLRIGLLLSVLVLAAACGEEGADGERADTTRPVETTSTSPSTSTEATTRDAAWPYDVDDYVAAISAADGPAEDLSPAESDCITRGMVTGLTIERLADAEITPEGLAAMDDMFELVSYREERALMVGALVECLDVLELAVVSGGLDAQNTRCLLQEIEEPWLAEVLLGTTEGEFEPTPESEAALDAIEGACPGLLAALG
jgi:hypothetical protein